MAATPADESSRHVGPQTTSTSNGQPIKPKDSPIFVFVFLLFIFVIAGVVIYLTENGGFRELAQVFNSPASPPSSPSPASQPAVEPISNIAWETIDTIYNIESKNTDLRKDDEWKRFKGKRIKWSGKVGAISTTFGNLTMQVKMNPTTFASDVIITLKDSEKSKAGKLRKDDTVTFVATLRSWGTLLPISLNDGEIVE